MEISDATAADAVSQNKSGGASLKYPDGGGGGIGGGGGSTSAGDRGALPPMPPSSPVATNACSWFFFGGRPRFFDAFVTPSITIRQEKVLF